MTEQQQPLCLDTSVLSLFFKRNDARKNLYLPDLEGEGRVLAITFITVGEMYRWALQRHWTAASIRNLEATYNRMVVLPYHQSVALRWAQIQTSTPKSENDAWIAACALAYGCTLVTDDNDFHGIQGLRLISHANEGRT